MAQRALHVAFYRRCMDFLTHQYVAVDSSRMTFLYFCVTGLDMLGALAEVTAEGGPLARQHVVEWIYNCQVTADRAFSWRHCGFKGGPFIGQPFDPDRSREHFSHDYDHGHIAMTYSALAALRTLGDDLSRVDRSGVVRAIAGLQQPSGRSVRTALRHCISWTIPRARY